MYGDGEYNKYFAKVGSSISSKPPQALKEKQKTKQWEKDNLDYFERVAHEQYLENLEFKQYYDMINGRVSYSDISDQPISMISEIANLRDHLDMPTDIEHFDFMGPMFHFLAGTWSMMKDKFSFASVDEISTNEFMREREDLMAEFSRKSFELEKNRRLIKMGFPIKNEFTSEEEQMQYMQQLEQQVQELFPEKVDDELRKNFKTDAAQWAEGVYERDYTADEIRDMEYQDAIDILVMGIAPRHIHIGHDYYKTERWDPLTVFYSKDADLRNLEDADEVGRMTYISSSELLDRYGHKLTFNQQKDISNAFWKDYTKVKDKEVTAQEVIQGKLYDEKVLPFRGADDLEMTLKFQSALGVPLGTSQDVEEVAKGPDGQMYVTKAGQEKMVWINGGNEWDYSPYSRMYAKTRTGQSIREDSIQMTEVYWRGLKWMGILFFEGESGVIDMMEVTEDILDSFLKENNIKTLKTKTLEDALREPEVNTLVPHFQPIYYKGVKINKNNTLLKEDIYFVEKLPFQIKGSQSNIYNIKSPVSSIVTEPLAPRLKPFQRGYDFEINKLLSLSEKELGTFFIFDINFLPTDFIDLDADAENALTQLYNLAKTFGIMPVDVSKHNTIESGGMPFNPLQQQTISFANDMQACISKAQFFKQQAMELIGVNPTAMGSPGKYETAEGIQVSQNALFAQTENIFAKFFTDKLRKIQTHVTVAQYCKLNNNDASYMYHASDGELSFLHSIKDDKYFSLRDINVMAMSDPKKIKEFETAKQILLQRNTMGNDELAFVEILASDDMLELKRAALKSRLFAMRKREQEQAHEAEIVDKKLAAENEQIERRYQYMYDALENKLEERRIDALGRAADNMEDDSGIAEINKQADLAIKKEMHNDNIQVQRERNEEESQARLNNMALKMEELAIKREKNKIEREKMKSHEFTSVINKN